MVKLFWALLQLSSVPFDDNGGERMGTLLRLGIAVKSIWRRPSPFYPARTSSALESCSFLARLPSSPQVVSETHPAAICRWLGLPPEILGKKNPEKQTLSSPRWEAVWRLSFLCIKEHWPWFEPPREREPPLIQIPLRRGIIQSYKEQVKSIRGWLLQQV